MKSFSKQLKGYGNPNPVSRRYKVNSGKGIVSVYDQKEKKDIALKNDEYRDLKFALLAESYFFKKYDRKEKRYHESTEYFSKNDTIDFYENYRQDSQVHIATGNLNDDDFSEWIEAKKYRKLEMLYVWDIANKCIASIELWAAAKMAFFGFKSPKDEQGNFLAENENPFFSISEMVEDKDSTLGNKPWIPTFVSEGGILNDASIQDECLKAAAKFNEYRDNIKKMDKYKDFASNENSGAIERDRTEKEKSIEKNNAVAAQASGSGSGDIEVVQDQYGNDILEGIEIPPIPED